MIRIKSLKQIRDVSKRVEYRSRTRNAPSREQRLSGRRGAAGQVPCGRRHSARALWGGGLTGGGEVGGEPPQSKRREGPGEGGRG